MILFESIKKSFVLWLVFFALFFSACEAATQVRGQVKDSAGKQLENVTVVMETNGNSSNGELKKKDEQKTKPDGTYNFVAITGAATEVRLTFTREGYKTQQLNVSANKQNVADVVLEPETK